MRIKFFLLSLIAVVLLVFINSPTSYAANILTNSDFSTNANGWILTNGVGTATCGTNTNATKTQMSTFQFDSSSGNPSGSIAAISGSTSSTDYKAKLTQTFTVPGTGTIPAKGQFDYFTSSTGWSGANSSYIRLDIFNANDSTFVGSLGCVAFNTNKQWTRSALSPTINLIGGTTYTLRVSLRALTRSSAPSPITLRVDNLLVDVGVPGLPTPTPTIVPTPTPTPTATPIATITPTATPTSIPTPTPPITGNYTLAAAGDISCNGNATSTACKQMDTSNMILSWAADAVMSLGDNQYENGEIANFNTYYNPSWGRLLPILHPAPGNHEYQTSGASGYFDYFNGVGNQTGIAGERGKGYYAFNIGSNWRVYVLNSNCSHVTGGCAAGSTQETWLKNDLAANPNMCQIMTMHYPYVSSDDRNFTFYNTLGPIWQDFYNAGGELDLTGHSHFYERYQRMNPARQADPNGIRQFIVGTGGKDSYGFNTAQLLSEKSITSKFGVLKLTLKPTSYVWEYFLITDPSVPADSGEESCH